MIGSCFTTTLTILRAKKLRQIWRFFLAHVILCVRSFVCWQSLPTNDFLSICDASLPNDTNLNNFNCEIFAFCFLVVLSPLLTPHTYYFVMALPNEMLLTMKMNKKWSVWLVTHVLLTCWQGSTSHLKRLAVVLHATVTLSAQSNVHIATRKPVSVSVFKEVLVSAAWAATLVYRHTG